MENSNILDFGYFLVVMKHLKMELKSRSDKYMPLLLCI